MEIEVIYNLDENTLNSDPCSVDVFCSSRPNKERYYSKNTIFLPVKFGINQLSVLFQINAT